MIVRILHSKDTMIKNSSQTGQISRVILILAGVVLIITIIVFIAIRITSTKKTDTTEKSQTITEIENESPKPVYDQTIGDIRFVLQSSVNLGGVLKSTIAYQQDLTTTERFIKVTIGAQNKGKSETALSAWELGNIIDSQGRSFIAITNKAFYFLPKPDLCGVILKPEFTPVPCIRIYEVSKKSEGLKIEVISKSPKVAKVALDLILP
ncbi:MAG: hypothetical protein AAB340_02405 [Patescibacteria group bacterium]